MTSKQKIVLCWHMHQPWYRESIDGEYHLPWVYLHALKDYTDMASHLEAHPDMRCVVNFTPVLLEQIDDYARQCRRWLDDATPFDDHLLNLLSGAEPIPADNSSREILIRACLRANPTQMIGPYPAFAELLDMVSSAEDRSKINLLQAAYLNDQYFYDLLTWYHLAWLGYSVKQIPYIQGLIKQARNFSVDDRRQLIIIFEELFSKLIPRYRNLAERDQVELSMTPYAHPIVPLMLDFSSTLDAMPDAPLPAYDAYPGGEASARWHLEHGISVFEHFFGRRPQGVWLSEGAISLAALKLLEEFDIRWTASGEGVWHNSMSASGIDTADPACRRKLFGCNLVSGSNSCVFFRDDGLSDLIGFEYQSWNSKDAVADFISHLQNISSFLSDDIDNSVVSVILDGENAWEYYPDNGWFFLDALYTALSENESIEVQTYQQASELCAAVELPILSAGSWVYGSFSTWIGEKDKNLGWELLVRAKQVFDQRIGRLDPEQAERARLQLAVCEGSDWFWWFGDYNPSDSVRDFDRLYRLQLQRLYHLLAEEVPEDLNISISAGGGDMENAGTMRRGHGN